MDPTKTIVDAVTEIRKIITVSSTLSVVGWCQVRQLRQANDFGSEEALQSPARQIAFLLGLLLQSPEPLIGKQLDDDEWTRVQELLNEAFGAYAQLYYPEVQEDAPLTAEWTKAREVAMPTFLHYVGSDLLASAEQIAERIRTYISPFDGEIVQRTGVCATDAVKIADAIALHLQGALDALTSASGVEKASRLRLLEQARASKWSMNELRSGAQRSGHSELAVDLLSRMNDLGHVSLASLRMKFGSAADAFWKTFTVARGRGRNIDFPTERSEYDRRPLILVDAETATCPSVNAMYTAILGACEDILQLPEHRDRYLRARDRACEKQAEELLLRFLGSEATAFAGLFERPGAQNEGDLVVLFRGHCLIVEVKASPPTEPFRDPDKAFVRLRRAFRSDTGIQGAFNQTERIASRLRVGEVVELFDARGSVALRLDPVKLRSVYSVVFTRDDIGPIAMNLAMLLEKASDAPYPWIVNAFDLATLCEAREYWDWDPDVLLNYLDERLKLHGKVFATDELDLFAFRLRHGTLKPILDADADLFVVDPHYADIFDEMYRARITGDEKVEIKVTPPVLTDLRRSLGARPLDRASQKASSTYPRNRPCPCDSGKKYKRCCGAA